MQDLEAFISDYKKRQFPQTSEDALEAAPSWQEDIGGLENVKEVIEEIFGVSSKYSVFFKG